MITLNNDLNYEDVTEEWIRRATPNSHKVREQKYFIYNNQKYHVDGKNVVLDYSKKECDRAVKSARPHSLILI